MWNWRKSCWTSWSYFCIVRFLLIEDDHLFFNDCLKNNVGMHLGFYEPTSFKLGMMIDTNEEDHDFVSRYENAKLFVAVVSQNS